MQAADALACCRVSAVAGISLEAVALFWETTTSTGPTEPRPSTGMQKAGRDLLTCIQSKAAHEVDDADVEDALDGDVHVLGGSQC